MRVVQGEVVDHNGHGEGDHEHPTDHTHTPHDVTPVVHRVLVAVTHRRHGDDGPPDGDGDVGEVVLLHVVNDAGEHEHARHEEDDHQQQLLGAHLDGVHQDLKGAVVLHQFEDTQDADDA